MTLKAWYVANQHSEKTVILSHGWRITKARMATFGDLFYNLGFNVLIPDNRAHGESGGKFIGFGYLDRFDYLQWIDMVCQKDQRQKIVLMGMSMGGTTVLSVSGEKLPNNVKAVISDSAYTSAYDELKYQAGHMFHLPAFPVLNVLNWMSGWRAGFQYSQADARPLIAKSQLPTLFIHGLADDFVPTKMVYELIGQHQGEHVVWLPKGAGHVAAFEEYPKEYIERVATFLNQHV
ncbi:hydrolase of the alpha/beta superfamily [Leuconostoc pseudomesenteroides 1159]|nr:hydrolase of the alpha/beta superfamily [Leuconostoc pseudomesenteroides 1159]